MAIPPQRTKGDKVKTQDMLKNEAQARASFWENHTQFTRIRGKRQNEYPTDVRCAFVDWVDYLHRSGMISDNLAHRVAL